jgi:hypothetical protein
VALTPLEQKLATALTEVLSKGGVATTPGTVGEAGPAPQPKRGIYQRAKQALLYTVADVVPATWFSPNQPLLPISQESGGRQWDYPVGYNLRITPRQNEPVGFFELRMLADSYDLLRLLVETRKDQLAKVKWAIVPVDEKKAKDVDNDPRAQEVEAFLRLPDRRHTWQQWLRMVLEEMLVIDAATVFPRMDRGGKPYSLDLIDGSLVKPVIDSFGRPPEPPSVAYQQIIKGVPAADFTLDQLLYMPRNKRVSKVYGYSPVEQITMTVNIALRRQIFQLQYYTEGSIPDLIMTTPENWTPAQIREFDENWNVMLRGDTANRRGAKWVPHGTEAVNTKEHALKDDYDEWLARVCCFAFSINPQPFVKQMNRATAETAQQAAMQEGLVPLMQWVEDLMNIIIWRYFGYLDLRFGWQDEEEIDPAVQSLIDDRNVKNGTASVDEIRVKRGDEPIGMGPAVYTQNGPIMVADLLAGTVGPAAAQAQSEQAQANSHEVALETAKNPPPAQGDDDGKPLQSAARKPKGGTSAVAAKPKSNGKAGADSSKQTKKSKAQAQVEKLEKADRMPVALSTDRKPVLAMRAAYESQVQDFLVKMAKAYADAVADEMPAAKLAKADWSDPDSDDPYGDEADRILGKVDVQGWSEFTNFSAKAMDQAVGEGGLTALANVGIGSPDLDMVSQVDARAVAYSQQRSAELVGMTRGAGGELVANPNPAYSISDSTRAMLRSTVAEGVEKGWSSGTLKSAIKDNYAFSPARAKMIARTEINAASIQGNLAGYVASGVVEGKQWILGDLHGISDPCDLNADDGPIGLLEPFSSGDLAPPEHPNCTCTVLPVLTLPKGE